MSRVDIDPPDELDIEPDQPGPPDIGNAVSLTAEEAELERKFLAARDAWFADREAERNRKR